MQLPFVAMFVSRVGIIAMRVPYNQLDNFISSSVFWKCLQNFIIKIWGWNLICGNIFNYKLHSFVVDTELLCWSFQDYNHFKVVSISLSPKIVHNFHYLLNMCIICDHITSSISYRHNCFPLFFFLISLASNYWSYQISCRQSHFIIVFKT